MSRGLFWYLGTDDIKFEAGVASESMITSQAHSIVVLRFADEKQPQTRRLSSRPR